MKTLYKVIFALSLLIIFLSCATIPETIDQNEKKSISNVSRTKDITIFRPDDNISSSIKSSRIEDNNFSVQGNRFIVAVSGWVSISEDRGKNWKHTNLSQEAAIYGVSAPATSINIYQDEDFILLKDYWNKGAYSLDGGESWIFLSMNSSYVAHQRSQEWAEKLKWNDSSLRIENLKIINNKIHIYRIVKAYQGTGDEAEIMILPPQGLSNSSLIEVITVPWLDIQPVPYMDGYVSFISKGDSSSGIWLCDEYYKNWRKAEGSLQLPSTVLNNISVDGNKLYVGTAKGLSISDDGGKTFQTIDTGVDKSYNSVVTRVGYDGRIETLHHKYPSRETSSFPSYWPGKTPFPQKYIYAVSHDEGLSWKQTLYDKNPDYWRSLYFNYIGEETFLYIATEKRFIPNEDSDFFTDAISPELSKLWESKNEGETWKTVDWLPIKNRQSGIPGVPSFIFAREGYFVIGSYADGLAISDDGGENWRHINFNSMLRHFIGPGQIDFDGQNFLICDGDRVLISSDIGNTWESVDFPFELSEEIWTCKIDGKTFLAYDSSSQYISTDNGRSWSVNPNFRFDDLKLYSEYLDDRLIHSNGVYWAPVRKVSYDQGKTWTMSKDLLENGLRASGYDKYDLLSAPSPFVVQSTKTVNGTLQTHLLMSKDNGKSWTKLWSENRRQVQYVTTSKDKVFQYEGNGIKIFDINTGKFDGFIELVGGPIGAINIQRLTIEPDGLFFIARNAVYRIETLPENGENIKIKMTPTGLGSNQNITFDEDGEGYIRYATSDMSKLNRTSWRYYDTSYQEQGSYLSMEINRVSGGETPSGLVFNLRDNSNFCSFITNKSGEFQIIEKFNNNNNILVDWTESNLIKPGLNTKNVLQVKWEKSKKVFVFSINGKKVKTIPIANFPSKSYSGKAGFIVSVGNEFDEDLLLSPVDIRFKLTYPVQIPDHSEK